MAIHEIQEGEKILYAISGDHVWLPGCYESKRAARYAFRFCVDHQTQLRDEAIATNNGTITFAMMQNMKKERGFSCGQGAHRPGWKWGDPLVFDKESPDGQ